MKKLKIAQYAYELGLPVALLLEQLKAAGIAKQTSDPMSVKDKVKLLEHLRQAYGAEKPAKKITLIRRETTEINKADSKELEASKDAVTPVKHKRQLKVDHYFSKVKKLLPEHPNECLNNMRKAVEVICKDILDETYEKKDEGKIIKPASAFTSLEDMNQELKRRKRLPVAIEKYLVVLQHYGNFGSHD